MFKWLKDSVDNVSEQFNLHELRDQLTEQFNQTLAALGPALGAPASEEVTVGHRRLRVLSKLGEGGYSFVYLAEEVLPEGYTRLPQRFALKKVLAGEREQLAAAEREVATMRRLPPHPALLPLLDAATVATTTKGPASHVVYMLFPLMEGGNLWNYVQGRLTAGMPLEADEAAVLFRQLVAALAAMHGIDLAHRDVKPHNILLGGAAVQHAQRAAAGAGADAAHLVVPAPPSAPSGAASEYKKLQPSETLCAALMDFGSAAPAVVAVRSRADALQAQEAAERHTTAPYRAPELWDAPSSCDITPAVDIWAAGCVLYYLLVGESPFERTANEAGGSLMLAVVNGQYSWPEAARERYPAALLELAEACLAADAAARPSAQELIERLDALKLQE